MENFRVTTTPESKKIVLAENLDLTTVTTSKRFTLPNIISAIKVSYQIVYSGLNAVDATVQLQQNNDPSLAWTDVTGSATLDDVSGAGTEIIEDSAFGGYGSAINLELNTVTEGSLTIVAVIKSL